MARRNHNPDVDVAAILDLLQSYKKVHRAARIDVQRENNVSIRIRVVDSDLQGVDEIKRDELIWRLLEKLPEDVASQITLVLPLTPSELKKSWANWEFDEPISEIEASWSL
ncbi:MAG: hypothetical protein L0Y72_04360 [Gemmataceae bacterium]|nr:hypothetical protein [Gemmataceae bacterium]MCI0738253.1 hypothetical protein [Gemmataceae bacterium]